MNERAFLLCNVIDRKDDNVKLKSELQDDSEFELIVSQHSIQMLDDGFRCWLEVEYSGEYEGIATITLPKPIIDKGHRVTVRTNRIKRVINKSKSGGNICLTKGVKGINSNIHQPGEQLSFERVEANRGWLIVEGDRFFIVPFESADIVK